MTVGGGAVYTNINVSKDDFFPVSFQVDNLNTFPKLLVCAVANILVPSGLKNKST